MKTAPCPACGAPVTFQSASSVFLVCAYCQSTLLRKDLDLEAIGKMAALQYDATPLQLGTTGKYPAPFTLIGRVRPAWSDGFWNEWFARFDNGREGWLAEAQGFYMLSFRGPAPVSLPAAGNLRPGLKLNLGKETYLVDDIREVTYSFAEGELPFPAPQGFRGISVDLRHGEDGFASILYPESAAGGLIASRPPGEFYEGKYLDFDKLGFANLRIPDGW